MKHLIAIAMLAVVGLHRTALADDPKAVAKQHIAAAKSFHEQRRFADALAALEAAYALDPQPQLLFAMGQLNVSLGRCERAIMFYDRFVATKPKPAAAALATEAIETCKTAPPPPEPAPPSEQPRAPLAVPLVTPTTPVVDVPATPASTSPAPARQRPWYTNYVADGLVLAGVASAVASVVVYQGARADRDRADAAVDYATYEDLIEGAQRKRTYALALGAAGAASAIAGGLYFVLGDADGRDRDHRVRVAPSRGGGVVTWGGRF